MILNGKKMLAQVAAFAAVSAPLWVSAQALPANGIVPCKGTNCTVCDLATLATNVLNTGIFIAVFLATVLFAYAGWQYLTSGGDAAQAGKARKVFTNVMVGMVIILAGWLIIDTLMGTMTKIADWYKLC